MITGFEMDGTKIGYEAGCIVGIRLYEFIGNPSMAVQPADDPENRSQNEGRKLHELGHEVYGVVHLVLVLYEVYFFNYLRIEVIHGGLRSEVLEGETFSRIIGKFLLYRESHTDFILLIKLHVGYETVETRS